MKPQVFIIHRWDGTAKDDWYPWLHAELTSRNFLVTTPNMPQTQWPTINGWVSTLTQLIHGVTEPVYCIGHSIGCQTILRTLENTPTSLAVKGALLVTPWMELINLEDEESVATAKPWTNTPINWEKITQKCTQFTCIFSSNDPFVPLSQVGLFTDKLKAKTLILPEAGHITDGQVPAILETFLSLT